MNSKHIRMLAACVGCVVGAAASVFAAPVQWRAEDGGNGHWYEVVVNPALAAWTSADAAARAAGAHLASVTSPAELAFITALANRDDAWGLFGPWLGGYQDTTAPDYSEPAGGWRWTSGEPFVYTAWSPGQPSNDCGGCPENYMHMYERSNGVWNDVGSAPCCNAPVQAAIFEWSADCNGDGLVDKGQILSGQLADSNSNGIPDVCEVQAPPLEWTQRLVTGPSPRELLAMTYDAARGKTVLFGGSRCCGTYFGDTWEWNGTVWSQRPVSGPPPRNYHAMVFDSARGVTVLFGGYYGGGVRFDDTWEWNGTVWSQLPVSGPSPRGGHAMAYDSARGVTVLFGGNSGAPGFFNETWEWNGTTWTQRAVTGPPGRSNFAMAYDSARGVTVLFGGTNSGAGIGTGVLGDTWEWNGTAWNWRASGGPAAREYFDMVYDSTRHVSVLFGGYTSAINAETWEWNGTEWRQQVVSGPSARFSHAMAYDAARHVTVLFGGHISLAGDTQTADTWEATSPCSTPSITSQPVNALLVPGLTANFEITATNSVSYQWRRNSTTVSDSARISGATTNALNITGVQSSDQGLYDCVVTNSCGTVTSNTAELSCKAIITQQPLGGTVAAGQTITLTGSATSAGTTTYRWKKDGVNVFNSSVYQGATTSTLSIAPTDPSNSGNYSLAITNTCGTTTTQSALVTVYCSADFNNDGSIDFFDYLDFVDAFSGNLSTADFNGDGTIDFFDYLDFVDRFSIGC